MAPKTAPEWKGVKVTRGALVTCADPCAHELMVRLNAEAGDTLIHTPLHDLKFFIREQSIQEFSRMADQLLNPLGKKRARAKQDKDISDDDRDD